MGSRLPADATPTTNRHENSTPLRAHARGGVGSLSGAPLNLAAMDLFARIERDLLARRDSGALARALRTWQPRREGLRRFEDIEALIAACREGREGSWEVTDAALAALCEEASGGEECAGLMLLWLLLPGLLLARERLPSFGPLGREDMSAEMLAAVWTEATRISRGDRRVAARLVNSARWRAQAAVREAIEWTARTASLTEDAPDKEPSPGYDLPTTEADPLVGAVRDGVLTREQAELALARHEALREICERLGIPLGTARKRRHRARRRLRAWLDET